MVPALSLPLRQTKQDQEYCCPACGQPMRLAASEPHATYTNLADRTYVCDCGGFENYIVRKD
jgi:hypothetical protein